jgi:hypothetical protein
MALEKQEVQEQGYSVNYWRITGINNFDILKRQLVVTVSGYIDEAARNANKVPVKSYDFLICNSQKRHQETRPATLQEKLKLVLNIELTADQYQEYIISGAVKDVPELKASFEVVDGFQADVIIREWDEDLLYFDLFLAELVKGYDHGVAYMYQFLKNGTYEFFKAANDLL